MIEELQTRAEHSQSLADAERFKAMQTLTELGLLVPLRDLETVHGRVGTAGEPTDWTVDPAHKSEHSDNANIHPTLYTGDAETAREFAMERANDTIRPQFSDVFRARVKDYTPEQRQDWLDRRNRAEQKYWDLRPEEARQRDLAAGRGVNVLSLEDLDSPWEVHRESERLRQATSDEEQQTIWSSISRNYQMELYGIGSTDPDALIIDVAFDPSKLEGPELEEYHAALKALIIPFAKGAPVNFDERASIVPFVEVLRTKEPWLIPESQIEEIAEEAGIDKGTARKLLAASNAFLAVQRGPAFLASLLLRTSGDIAYVDLGEDQQRVPISIEYIQMYFRSAHIVGAKQEIDSASLAKPVTSISLFDLEKVNTSDEIKRRREATRQRLGELASAFDALERREFSRDEQPLIRLLTDPHAKPEALIEAAKKIDTYAGIFDADAGNWEGFTLAEHTETVLRNFDENFADSLPVEFIAPMRLAIIAHDLGKPHAVAVDAKHLEKDFNVAQATDFFDKLGITEPLKELLLAVIGDGSRLAFEVDVRKSGDHAEAAMTELAETTMKRFFKTEQVSESQIEAFKEMCKILQICDGGAYTSMAVTRRPSQGWFRNAPSFNASFAEPVGFGKRGLRLR